MAARVRDDQQRLERKTSALQSIRQLTEAAPTELTVRAPRAERSGVTRCCNGADGAAESAKTQNAP
jgi:hypothetical protein